MATITEILAEAFNRVKTEHGVNVSSVEFEHYSGNLQGVTFTSSGSVYLRGPAPIGAMPPQVPAVPIAHTVDPNDCTHVGSVDVYDDCYWKFEGGVLYLWDGSGTWNTFDSGESAQRTVDSQLSTVNGYEIPRRQGGLQQPIDATHFGTVADCENCFWKLDDHQMYMWSDDKWHFYFSLNPNATVATLTPVNPA